MKVSKGKHNSEPKLPSNLSLLLKQHWLQERKQPEKEKCGPREFNTANQSFDEPSGRYIIFRCT
jgi:hypothetical protein